MCHSGLVLAQVFQLLLQDIGVLVASIKSSGYIILVLSAGPKGTHTVINGESSLLGEISQVALLDRGNDGRRI